MEETTIYPAWKQALQDFVATDPQPGTVISKEWKLENFNIRKPANIEDVERYQLELMSAFASFSGTLLEEHQIYLRPAGRGAHVVVPPSEQTGDAMSKRTREIGRAINNLRVELVNVNVGGLTHEQRKENSDAQVKAAMIATMFRKTKRLRLPVVESISHVPLGDNAA